MPRTPRGRGVAALCWAYALLGVALWLVLHTLGDRWWLATVLMYGPRWLCGLPMILLVPLAAWKRPRSLLVLAATACVIVGPVMGFCIPWSQWRPAVTGASQLRILSFNLQKNNVNCRALEAFIDQTQPDVLVFQEWGGEWGPRWGGLPNKATLQRQGWHVRTREALMIASRYPIVGESALHSSEIGGDVAAIKRVVCFACDLETPGGVIRVFNFHGSTPRVGLEAIITHGPRGLPALLANTRMRQSESKAVSDWTRRAGASAIVAGDFNLPVESAVFQRHWSMYGDAFTASGWGFGTTKFEPLIGARIDHILAGDEWQFRRSWVGPFLGSDHRPVLAELSRSNDRQRE